MVKENRKLILLKMGLRGIDRRGNRKMKIGSIKLYIFLIINLLLARIPDAVGTNGMVVSSHEFASQVGIDILRMAETPLMLLLQPDLLWQWCIPELGILVVADLW